MRKLKKGDEVIVIAGKDKGKRGSITRVLLPKKRRYGPKRGLRVTVAGVNLMKKHQKANPQANIEAGIIELEAPMDASNVAIWNPTSKRADRVGIRFLEDGTKIRYFKSDGESVDV